MKWAPAAGGVLKGQSPAPLVFLKQVLDDAPADGIEPIDKWQNPEYGGKPYMAIRIKRVK